jgi:hypothetical protein
MDEYRFNKGKIDIIEQEMYWMNKLPRPLHNADVYKLNVNHHLTPIYSTLAVFADTLRFQRVLWKQKYLQFNCNHILYSFIEKDSLEFLLDNWLCNHRETIPDTETMEPISSIEPWKTCFEYRHYNPYSVVPIFKNAEEHEMFIEYVEARKNDFIQKIGDYKGDIYRGCHDYIDYLCTIGKTLVNWLDEWRTKNSLNYAHLETKQE